MGIDMYMDVATFQMIAMSNYNNNIGYLEYNLIGEGFEEKVEIKVFKIDYIHYDDIVYFREPSAILTTSTYNVPTIILEYLRDGRINVRLYHNGIIERNIRVLK